MILTSEYAITCSSDYQMGILYRDSEILQALWNLFHSHQDLCQPVFQTFPIVADDLPSLFQFVANTRASADVNLCLAGSLYFAVFMPVICWKKSLIIIFPGQIPLSLWPMPYFLRICRSLKMRSSLSIYGIWY